MGYCVQMPSGTTPNNVHTIWCYVCRYYSWKFWLQIHIIRWILLFLNVLRILYFFAVYNLDTGFFKFAIHAICGNADHIVVYIAVLKLYSEMLFLVFGSAFNLWRITSLNYKRPWVKHLHMSSVKSNDLNALRTKYQVNSYISYLTVVSMCANVYLCFHGKFPLYN